jgi:TusA-related sulfurtransferase
MSRRERRRQMAAQRAPDGLSADATLDTLGLYCPMPIIKTAERLGTLASRAILEVVSDDRVILEDMPAWCLSTGHEYLGFREEPGEWRLFVRRR